MGRCSWLLVLALAIAGMAPVVRAAVDDDDNSGADQTHFRGGLLLRNGQQTSCEIALIDGAAAFIAASCVTDGDGKVDRSASFEIQVDHLPGRVGAGAPLLSRGIAVHPAYDPTTFANNIAVVQFELDPAKQWHIGIAIERSEWTGSMFMRRRMDDVSGQTWAAPSTSWRDLSDPDCAQSYGLYGANRNDFKCTSDTAPPMANSACGVPFGTYYGVMSGRPALAGLYSHSVIDGNTLCAAKSAVHYYTLVSSYIAFAQRVLGRGVTTVSQTNAMANPDASYKMAHSSFVVPAGKSGFTGNEFAGRDDGTWRAIAGSDTWQNDSGASADASNDRDPAAAGTGDSGASTASSWPPGARATDTVTGPPGSDDVLHTAAGDVLASMSPPTTKLDNAGAGDMASARHGLSKGQVAAIVVCLVLGTLAAIGAFFGLRWCRRRREQRQWSPTVVQQILESHMVENETGTAPSAKFDLPSYRHHRGTALVAAGPSSIE
ncbi:hypothetical protein H4R19_004383 [Coemansia spiralis]|nr:hypothetical protein H4R19_004383 [Coemansia spiralis]